MVATSQVMAHKQLRAPLFLSAAHLQSSRVLFSHQGPA